MAKFELWKEFKKKLIDKDITIKKWCQENGIDRDRMNNIKNGFVQPTEDEVRKISLFIER